MTSTTNSPKRRKAQWNEDTVEIVGENPHRKVIAKRPLRRGEEILREAPTCTLLHAKQWGERCHSCFTKHSKLLRCGRCRKFWYCSKECQRNDWKEHHKEECASMTTYLASNAMSPEEEQTILVDALLAARIFALEENDAERYNAVMDLVFHRQCIQPAHYQVAKLVLNMGLVAKRRRTIDEREIVEMTARFDSNNFGIVDELLFLQGTGVYPAGAMLNHSCHPNCAIRYQPITHTQIICCIVDQVQAGDELCHPYIDFAMTSLSRREKLQSTYGFDCQCPRCLDVEGRWSQADTYLTCPALGVDESLANSVIAISEQWLQETVLMAEENVNQELRLVLQCVTERAKVLHPRHLSLYRARSQLHTTAMAASELGIAKDQCVEMVATMRKCFYQPEHPMMGIMLYTLGSLHHSLAEFVDAIQCYDEALPVLEGYHGRNHHLVAGCRDYLVQARQDANQK